MPSPFDDAANQLSSFPTSKLKFCLNHKDAKVGSGRKPADGSIATSTPARFSGGAQLQGNINWTKKSSVYPEYDLLAIAEFQFEHLAEVANW